jgi:phage shock protein C
MDEEKKEMRKLYRSRTNRFIGGVSGGLGEYFNVDANLFRILFVVFTFIGGIGLVLYLAAIIIVPENPLQEKVEKHGQKDKTVFWALLLIVLGVLLILREFGFFHYFRFWHVPWSSLWAIFLIIIGIMMILSVNKASKSGQGEEAVDSGFPEINRITRSRKNRMLAGVCGGIAEYFKVDPSLVRLLWIFASLASIGLGILVYVVLIFVFPEESQGQLNA